jgi:hypothetical protein
MLAFIRSLGGAVDGVQALNFALDHFPELDPALTLELVDQGDHYESMIDPGIARALGWLAKTYRATTARAAVARPWAF